MNNTRFWLLVAMLLFPITKALYALDNFNLPQINTFYKHQYQASNRNWSISHGNDGYIYIGNDDGLLSYDGVNWIVHELPSRSKVRSVCVAKDGLIYTGSAEEIGYWERHENGQLVYQSINHLLEGVTFHNQEIWRIYENSIGDIVFQGFNIILKYNGTKVSKLEVDVMPHLMVKDGERLYGSTRRGDLLELTSYGFIKVAFSNYLKDARLKGLMPLEKGTSLLATKNNGLLVLDGEHIEVWNTAANRILKSEEINCCAVHEDLYYIGTIHSGIYIVNKKGEVLYNINSENHLQDNTILDIKFDNYGRLWFTMSVGIGYAELNSPISFLIDPNRRIGAVHSVAHFKNQLYLATNKGVFVKPFEKGEVLTTFDDFIPIEQLTGLSWSLKVVDGQLLCGHNKGTYRIENKSIIKIANFAGGKSFKKLYLAGVEYLIQNTYKELVIYQRKSNGNWAFKTTVEDFSEPTMELAIDHKNQIWVQHDRKSELYRLRLQQNLKDAYSYNVYHKENGLPQDMTSEVFGYKKRIVITSSKGLYTYDELKDSIVSYERLNQQLGDFRNSHRILPQIEDVFWFIKDRQIALFQITSMNANKLLQYEFNEPYIGLVEDFENIVHIDSLGSFVCLENGLGIMNQLELKKLKETYASKAFNLNVKLAYISKRENVSKHIKAREVIVLPYKHEELALQVAALVAPGKALHLTCRLKSESDSVSYEKIGSSINFSALPAGEYEVEISAVDGWGRQVAPFCFELLVEKPLWLKTGFISILSVLLILVLVVVIVRFRRNLRTYIPSVDNENDIIREKHEPENINTKLAKAAELEQMINAQNNHIATGALNSIRNKEVLLALKDEVKNQKEKLGLRYPDKYYNKIVELIDSNLHTEDDWLMFEEHFDKANGDFVGRLKSEFPQLTPRDLRLCAYLKMNLSSKEIAPLLGISERSVEVHRYRMRKKMNLPSDRNLSEFMISY